MKLLSTSISEKWCIVPPDILNINCFKMIGNSIWLYLYFILHANKRTWVIKFDINHIAKETGFKPETIGMWLGLLKKHNHIRLKKGTNPKVFINQGRQINRILYQLDISPGRPRSRSKRNIQNKKTMQLKEMRDRARKLAQDLGEGDNVAFYERICSTHSADQVDQVLSKVVKIPSSQIKKSRAALFNYLIKSYDKNI